jgi:Domain of unknown function (DUF4258)
MSSPKSVRKFVFTDHALSEMARRGISEDQVTTVLAKPGQSEPVRKGRTVYQSKISFGEPPKEYILRIFVDTDRDPPQVVTAYKTSKFEKYWR